MRSLVIICTILLLYSCYPNSNKEYRSVMGSKPIYTSFSEAKKISYSNQALPVLTPGNIYAKGNLIYQLEIGKGIHVIDNSVPSQARRVGFIIINGSSQISIKGNYLYSNSYDDLVVLDISNQTSVTEVKRVSNAFPQGNYEYPLAEPTEKGYYECIRYDSVIIGWQKAKVLNICYKN